MNDKVKTIKEEMESQKLIITIEVDPRGGMTWKLNKSGVPYKLIRGILHDLEEVMLMQEIGVLSDQKYMKKLGLKTRGNS